MIYVLIFALGFLCNSVVWRIDNNQTDTIIYPSVLLALCAVAVAVLAWKQWKGESE